MSNLLQLYRQHRGKVSDKWLFYLREYHRLLSPYRHLPLSMLEIGIQNGGSLEIWSRYFSNAKHILGCDINPDCAQLAFDDQRIAVIVGNANSNEAEREIRRQVAGFDLIIDDGSHVSGDIVGAFVRYFPLLKPGGLFLAEDLHCSYWKDFEGGLHYPYSALAFFKQLADIINYEHWGVAAIRSDLLAGFAEHYALGLQDAWLAQIHTVQFSNSMCVIRKQEAAANRLGPRFIAGRDETVVSGHLALSGQSLAAPDQSLNPWSVSARPMGEQLVSLHRLLANQDVRHQGRLDWLRDQLRDQLVAAGIQSTERVVQLQVGLSELDAQMARYSATITALAQALDSERQGHRYTQALLEQARVQANTGARLLAAAEIQLERLHGEDALQAETISALNHALDSERQGRRATQALLERLHGEGALQAETINALNHALDSERQGHRATQALLEQTRVQAEAEARLLVEAEAEARLLVEAEARLNESTTRHSLHCQGLEQAVAALQSSLSWRLTAPLRMLGNQGLRIGRGYRLAQTALRLGGGLPATLSLTARVLQTEGWRGLRWRLDNAARLMDSPVAPAPRSAWAEARLCPNQVAELADEPAPARDYRDWKDLIIPGEVDIIVCVHNALEDVRRCLSSVVRYSLAPCRLILVDDGSDEETGVYLDGFAAQQGATLIRNAQAKGYTLAANQGLRQATGHFVVLLNSDTLVTPGWIEKLIGCALSDPQIGLVGPLSNTASWQSIPDLESAGDWADNPLPPGMTLNALSNQVARNSARRYPRLAFLNGFCLLIKREVLDAVGLFDEDNFGQGYGEENDYCLRARQAGWDLAVADDAYVYHAQSKSYSHEKRMALVRRSDAALASKHGSTLITRGVLQCRQSRVLMSCRAYARRFQWRDGLRQQGLARWEGRRVLFMLPIMHAGGGANVVIAEGRAMQSMGVAVALANLEMFRPSFLRSYPRLDLPVHYLPDPAELPGLALGFDAVVATVNHSVFWMAPLAHPAPAPVLGYYVQDYEPYFFQEGTDSHRRALDSYRAFPGLKLFTKTDWNAALLQDELGVAAAVVGASYDADTFKPFDDPGAGDTPGRALRITAMVRPSTPRRNPAGTMRVLQALKQAYGDRLVIDIFGAEADGPPVPVPAGGFDYVDHGQIFGDRLIQLLSRTDIFLDMSDYQAMGLTAMEAMACGAVPAVPKRGGAASFAIEGRNALVVPTDDEAQTKRLLGALIGDPARLAAMRAAAIDDIAHFVPEMPAFKILEYLFG